MSGHGAGLHAWPVEGIGEVAEGTDLADLLADVDLRDGDVVVVTSKVVAKAEGRVRADDREDARDRAVDEESVRVVARRGGTRIVEHHLGLVMAAAGVDASNVAAGHLVLLPLDPDGSARRLRTALRERRGVDVAVVVTDTAGRAWRTGQTDLAVGLAGLEPLEVVDETDAYGNPLVVTAPAVADELAGVAELVTGKTGGRPVSIVRGLGDRLLPTGEHGPGARALVRPRSQDMFALGAREAVLAALASLDADCFGSPVPVEELLQHLADLEVAARAVDGTVEVTSDDAVVLERARLAAHALAWTAQTDRTDQEDQTGRTGADGLVLRPRPAG